MKIQYPLFKNNDEILNYIKKQNLNYNQKNFLANHLANSKYPLEQLDIDNGELYWLYFFASLKKCKDYQEQFSLIDEHLDFFTSWYHVDAITKYLKKLPFQETYLKAKQYINNPNLYIRRLGYVLFMFSNLIKKENLHRLFLLFKNDNEYYVQMVEAWLLCEIYVHYPKETYIYLENCSLQYNIISKTVRKIKDSTRISTEDKIKIDMLKDRKRGV